MAKYQFQFHYRFIFFDSFNVIFVAIDRFIKKGDYIVFFGASVNQTAFLFVREIFRLHGLPVSIVSERHNS